MYLVFKQENIMQGGNAKHCFSADFFASDNGIFSMSTEHYKKLYMYVHSEYFR